MPRACRKAHVVRGGRVQLSLSIDPRTWRLLVKLSEVAGVPIGSAAGLVLDGLTPLTENERRVLISEQADRVASVRAWAARCGAAIGGES